MIPAATPPQALSAGDLAGPPPSPPVSESGFPVLIATLAEASVPAGEGTLRIAVPGSAGEPQAEAPADPSPLVRDGLEQLMAVVRSSIGRAGGREANGDSSDGPEESEVDGEATSEAPAEARHPAELPSASLPPPPSVLTSRALAGEGGSRDAIAAPKRAAVPSAPLPDRGQGVAPGTDRAGEHPRHARLLLDSGPDGENGTRIGTDSLPQSRIRAVMDSLQARRAATAPAEDIASEADRGDSPTPAALVRAAQPAQPPVPAFQPNAAVLEQPQAMSAAGPVDAAPAELAVDRQLDLALDGEWLDQLAQDIARSAGEGRTPLRFRLHPEHLGHLKVEILQDAGGAAVRLTTDNEAARSIIADAQPRLISEARAQGVRISEAHVDLGGQQTSGDPRREQAQQEPLLRTARILHEGVQGQERGDGKPTPARAERYA